MGMIACDLLVLLLFLRLKTSPTVSLVEHLEPERRSEHGDVGLGGDDRGG